MKGPGEEWEVYAAGLRRRDAIIAGVVTVAVVVALVAIVVGLAAVSLSTYEECRAHGFSVLYCWTRG